MQFILGIIKNYKRSTRVLAAGGFLEIWVASLIRRFDYVVKIPGDIVWERARNSKVTDLNILDFQRTKLNPKYRIFRGLFSASIQRAKRVIVPSRMLENLVSDWINKETGIDLIYNSINSADFTGSTTTPKKFDLLTACRLVPWKGVEELIHSCSELGLTLAIAGEGPERQRLEQFAKDLGAEVTFLGQVPKTEMLSIYLSCDTFVLNSSYEGLPHALIEAKASGMLCIARSNTGSEEVITDMVDGLLVGGQLGDSLTVVLKQAANDRALKARLGRGALEDVKTRFEQEKNFFRILEVMETP